MTESDDKLAARYRELAREEPPAHADAAILAAARGRTPVHAGGMRPRFERWAVPASIAAVLVLGVGVSLRMQMEKPGIETSVPSSAPAEYPVPQAEPQPPARADTSASKAAEPEVSAPATRADADPPRAPAPKPKALRKEQAATAPRVEEAKRNTAEPAPRPFTDAPVTVQAQAPAAAPAIAPTAESTAPTAAPPPSPAPPPRAAGGLSAQAPAAAAAPQSALRAKREALTTDAAAGAREMRRETEPDPDPARELERIARLRAAGNHADADRALDQFRKRHPDYRIADAVWERVRPR